MAPLGACAAGDHACNWSLVSLPAASGFQGRITAFHQGLKDTGYAEGQVAIEFRWAEGHYDRLPALADARVHGKADVVVTIGVRSLHAAKAAAKTIPVVFMMVLIPSRRASSQALA